MSPLERAQPLAPPSPCEPAPAASFTVASSRRVRRRAGLAGGSLAALLALVHAANDALTAVPTVLLPSLQQRFALSETALAAIVALMWASSSVTQPLFGAVADRVGRRGLAVGGVAVSSVLFGLIGVVPAAWLVFVVVLVGGLGSAALHPVGSSLARGDGGPRSGLMVSLFSAGGMIGFAIGPVVVLAVVGAVGLAGTAWLMLPGLLLAGVLWLAMPPDARADGQRHRLVDLGLLRGPVGALVVAGVLADLAFVTFLSAMPLWLVAEQGVAADAPLVGWTLSAFALAAGVGAIVSGVLASRVSRRALVTGSLSLSVIPLLVTLHVEAGSVASIATVTVAGALVYASFPLMILTAQDLAPDAVTTASGMLMGLATGVAGVLYIAVGALQELIGLTAAMSVAYLALVPAAVLSFAVLTRHRAALGG